MVIKETNVTVMVRDLDASIAFYTAIGLTLKQRWENHYAMVETTGVTIGLHPSDGSAAPTKQVSIGFMIDDINEAKALLTALGTVYALEDGKSGLYVHFTDPDGMALYFTQPLWKY
jgi:catechol 2,3-dioxygenase-like lactoylglutathione lyase family enzyme